MTDNIQKLYEIAGVNKRPQGYCDFQYGASCPYDDQNCDTTCPYWVDEEPAYPPFTAEKQLELIKWLLHHKQTTQVELRYFGNSYYITHCTKSKNKNYEYVRDGKARLFDNSIADLFCDMWQNLTDKQKQEIKEILE